MVNLRTYNPIINKNSKKRNCDQIKSCGFIEKKIHFKSSTLTIVYAFKFINIQLQLHLRVNSEFYNYTKIIV